MNRFKQCISVVVVVMGIAMFCPTAFAADDWARPLKAAQKSLSSGEYDAAYPQYLQYAKQGNALAQFTVGMFHQLGWGKQAVDPAAACGWFEKAAAGHIPTATHYLGDCFVQGIGRPSDPAKAAQWYQRAAGLGHYLSLCSLAELYMQGKGVEKNPRKALDVCLQAAEKGAVPAQVQVGRYLLEGDPDIRDPKAAYRWFALAAASSAEARYYLGVIHRDGLAEQAKLPEEALTWFERSASLGYLPAYFPTATLYFQAPADPHSGQPTAKNLAKAYMWLSATQRRSQNAEELEQTDKMLKQVLAIMPSSWVATLDKRIATHFDEYVLSP